MKKSIILIALGLSCGLSYGQLPPAQSGQGVNSQEFWSRSGNNQGGSNNNIFGTRWNSPIYTVTGGISPAHVRMKLNGDFTIGQYSINSYGTPHGLNTTGYMGLGVNTPIPGNQFLWSNKGPFSLLHLNGRNGAFVQEGGFRPWMQAGITFTDNQDLSYIGLRRMGSVFDITETVIAWSDNNGTLNGPDELSFRFMGEGNGNNTISSTDLQTTGDLDGLHVARFTGTGEFGLGNTFGVNPAGTPANLYVRPQSLAHYSLSNFRSVWQQFTNRNTAAGSGTGETASDGLRIGIIGNANLNANGTAAIYNQELRPLLFSTNANTNGISLTNGTTLERVRIMSAGTPTHLSSGGFGIYNPAAVPANITRMAVSHNPSQPVTRPLSLLHLGYNTGLGSSPPGSTDGWRPWMDIGTFTTNGTDNIYVGLKDEGQDRFDAVVSWGDNQSAGPVTNEGPDNLRFIFTSTTSSVINPGDPVSTSTDGLEVARMEPGQASTLTGNFGMVGIGNFAPNGPNTAPADAVDAKLDIDGDLRIRTVTQDNSLNRVLVIDPEDHNRVHWADIDLPSGGAFVPCADTTGAGNLTADSKVGLNDNNLYFLTKEDAPSLDDNRVGIGYNCSDSLPGKLSVKQLHDQSVPKNTVAGHFLVQDIANNPAIITQFTGTYGEASGLQPQTFKTFNKGGEFFAKNAQVNYGVYARAEQGEGDPDHIGIQNIGGNFIGDQGKYTAIGVWAQGGNAAQRNIGINGTATSPTVYSTIENIGGQFSGAYSAGENMGIKTAGYGGNHAYGIYAQANGGTMNHAGYFTGDVHVTGTATVVSDQLFKTEVSDLDNSLETVAQLRPVKYSMDADNYPQFNFSTEMQYGFIAQEVEEIAPSLVQQNEHPAQYDSLGTQIAPAIAYKALNYIGIIPINTQAIIELNRKVERADLSDGSVKTNVNDLAGSLEKVLTMRGVSYEWDQAAHPGLKLDSSEHIGFIAQEIDAIDARLTYVNKDGLLHVKYEKVVPLLAEAIQELNEKVELRDSVIEMQQQTIEGLNDRLSQLENCLSGILPFLCQLSQKAVEQNGAEVQEQLRHIIDVELTNGTAIVLNQNVPNPFAESTVIAFSIPQSVQTAQIIFHDATGALIKTVDIRERGNGQINVYANDLSTGTYTYSLVADDKIVATKRMVKQ